MGFLEVVAPGGPYFAGFVLRNFVLSMFLAALAFAVGPASLGDVDLWMVKVLALSANEHDGTVVVHCISLQPRIRPRLLPLQACNWCSPGLAHQSESDVVSRGFFGLPEHCSRETSSTLPLLQSRSYVHELAIMEGSPLVAPAALLLSGAHVDQEREDCLPS
jgi:hypothetical protein